MRGPAAPRRLVVEAGGLRHGLLHLPGEGPALVVVPGITSTAATSAFFAAPLAEDHNVFALDPRGRGRSGRAPSGRYRLEDYAADLLGVCEALGLERPALLGHSMGARIVAAAAGRLARGPVVLVDPPLSGPGRPYPTSRQAFVDQMDEAARGTTVAELRRWYPGWPEAELELRRRALPTCDRLAVLESYDGLEDEEFEPLFCALDAPAALVRGAESPVVTAEDAERLAVANPSVPIRSVARAGHMVPWDNLAGFLDAVRPLLGVAGACVPDPDPDTGTRPPLRPSPKGA